MTNSHAATASHAVTALQHAAATAPMLNLDEEQDLVERMRGGDRGAQDLLMRAHFRLVMSIARSFSRRSGVPTAELVSEGLLALTLAARRYEPCHGVRFGGYATMWIRGLMSRYSLANRRIVRAPNTRQGRRLLARLSAAERAVARNGGKAEAEDVARMLGVAVDEVYEARAALRDRDLPFDEVSGGAFLHPGESPEILVAAGEEVGQQRAVLHALVEQLDPREQEILRRRYLVVDTESLIETGRVFGISGERVRQIEKTGCEKIKRRLHQSGDRARAGLRREGIRAA